MSAPTLRVETTYELFCLVQGDSTVFSVDVPTSKSVSKLRQVIYETAIHASKRDILAKDLVLWKVNIDLRALNQHSFPCIEVKEDDKGFQRLMPWASVSSYWPSGPELSNGHLHIIAQRPRSNTSATTTAISFNGSNFVAQVPNALTAKHVELERRRKDIKERVEFRAVEAGPTKEGKRQGAEAEERVKQKVEKPQRKAEETKEQRKESESAQKAKATADSTPNAQSKRRWDESSVYEISDESDDEVKEAERRAKSVVAKQAVAAAVDPPRETLRDGRRCHGCVKAGVLDCVVMQTGGKKACERCSVRKHSCEGLDGAAVPLTKRRRTEGLKGEGMSAAGAAKGSEKPEAIKWLQRIGQGQDDVRNLLDELLRARNYVQIDHSAS